VLAGVEVIHAVRGRRVITLSVDGPDVTPDDRLALLLGPTGNLRAPAIRAGRVLLVGFDEPTYRRILA
jgi:hypothetical protein